MQFSWLLFHLKDLKIPSFSYWFTFRWYVDLNQSQPPLAGLYSNNILLFLYCYIFNSISYFWDYPLKFLQLSGDECGRVEKVCDLTLPRPKSHQLWDLGYMTSRWGSFPSSVNWEWYLLCKAVFRISGNVYEARSIYLVFKWQMFKDLFILVKNTWQCLPFKPFLCGQLVALRTFTLWYNHQHCPSPELCIILNWNAVPSH